VLAIRLHIFFFTDGSGEIWTPFTWLLRLLRTLPESNSLEELTLHIVLTNSAEHSYIPTDYLNARIPWRMFGPLLMTRFPHLRNVKLLLQAAVISILNKIVDREHPQAIELEKMGILKIEEWDDDSKINLFYLIETWTY